MSAFLVVDVAHLKCAFPLTDVAETMRPLPLQAVSGAPEFLLGITVLRGAAVPVIDMAELTSVERLPPGRFVSLKAGERRFVVAVTRVAGIVQIANHDFSTLPPLIEGQDARKIALKDGDLLQVLSAARLLSEQQWRRVDEDVHGS